MALRAMYKGFKKVLAPLIINRPGELAIDQDALNAELNTVFFPRSEQEVLGAKNILNAPASVTVETTVTTFTEIGKCSLKAGQVYTFSCVQETTLTSNTRNTLVVSKAGMSPSLIESDTQNYHLSSGLHKMTFTAPTDGEYTFNVWCHTPSADCTYSQFQTELGDVETPSYVPFALTNSELTENLLTKLFANPVNLTNSDDLDDISTAGIYSIASSVPLNAPSGMANTYACLLVIQTGAAGAPTQIYIQGGWRSESKHIAIRGFGGTPASWSAWRYVTDATAS